MKITSTNKRRIAKLKRKSGELMKSGNMREGIKLYNEAWKLEHPSTTTAAPEATDKDEFVELRTEIAEYLDQYELDSIQAYQAAVDILWLCKKAGLRKFAPAE